MKFDAEESPFAAGADVVRDVDDLGARHRVESVQRLVEDEHRRVVRDGLRLVLAGAVAGIIFAVMVGRGMNSLLFGVAPHDPATFGAVAGLMALIGIGACWIPARRAMRADPMEALRYE